MKIPVKIFFQNSAEVSDLTTDVNLLSNYSNIYMFCYFFSLRSENNNFSFTGFRDLFYSLEAIDRLKQDLDLFVY